jgi:amino acid transporter
VVGLSCWLVATSSIGGVSAWFAAAARLPFMAGIDRFLPPAFGRLHRKYKTPYMALIVQGLIAVFIFLGQAGTQRGKRHDRSHPQSVHLMVVIGAGIYRVGRSRK